MRQLSQDFEQVIVVHYGEIAIKGRNRIYFERRLSSNIKTALKGHPLSEVRRLRGRIVIHFSAEFDSQKVRRALSEVFGISYFSPAYVVQRDLEIFKRFGLQLIQQRAHDSFQVQARRSQKNFPLNSMEINREVGAHIQSHTGKRVDLTNPDITLYIELTDQDAFMYDERLPGLRGMPVGVSERAVTLLSSGIDSPVASYLMLKRGVFLTYVHFHSHPYTNVASQENTRKLVEVLVRHQYQARLFLIPFIDIQKQIMTNAPAELRVLLYRRYMLRLAERIAERERATALVTGENVGQVASQTLSNIRAVGEVTRLPILRPLAGFDKEEIVALARKIGTFEISTEPYEDCCSLFVPESPATRSKPRQLDRAEASLDMAELMLETLERSEQVTFDQR